MSERIGFIGLGRMGTAMAANLARAGFPLTVHNRSPGPMAAFAAEHGTATAADPAALAEASDVVITMLADDEALRDVMAGPRGAIAGLRPGSLVIDMGTVGRQVILELAGPIAERGAELIDAPVSGVPKVAAEGRLVIMVGADDALLERARPVLDAMSERIIHVGPRGAGAAMKVAINAANPRAQPGRVGGARARGALRDRPLHRLRDLRRGRAVGAVRHQPPPGVRAPR